MYYPDNVLLAQEEDQLCHWLQDIKVDEEPEELGFCPEVLFQELASLYPPSFAVPRVGRLSDKV